MIQASDAGFAQLLERCGFTEPKVRAARRAIVLVALDRVADSCGYGVPLMTYGGLRPHQDAWAQKKLRVGGESALLDYQRDRNDRSIDGLPALEL